MHPFPIPVVAAVPGFEDEALNYMDMPHEMNTFAPPRVAEVNDPAVRAEALAALEGLLGAMRGWPFGAPGHPEIDLGGLSREALDLVNDALGQGEVSILASGADMLRIQETVFAGVWRLHQLTADGRVLRDAILAGALPAEVVERARAAAKPARVAPPVPPGVINAPAILCEVLARAAAWHEDEPAHIVNLSLLPFAQADQAWLVAALGGGAVSVLSRGYGNCRVSSTGLANTWWVQYFNSADGLILNTLEVTALPEVVPAAAEDFAVSLARLEDWIATLRKD